MTFYEQSLQSLIAAGKVINVFLRCDLYLKVLKMTETSATRRNFSISRSGKFKRRNKDRVSITDQHWITPDIEFEFERIINSQKASIGGNVESASRTLGQCSQNAINDKSLFTTLNSNDKKSDKNCDENASSNEFVNTK
ncbi:unnamed protein product [Chironomus riparius]|uniref:Uncharacterized protein n=1 Tax=Chironomus riparius TaxID=315576 RepID=A0A9N9WXH2_9DIPT|nr:unnamed protein product [Chironomus riparius]